MSLILFLEKEMRSAASHEMSIGTEKGPHVDDDVMVLLLLLAAAPYANACNDIKFSFFCASIVQRSADLNKPLPCRLHTTGHWIDNIG